MRINMRTSMLSRFIVLMGAGLLLTSGTTTASQSDFEKKNADNNKDHKLHFHHTKGTIKHLSAVAKAMGGMDKISALAGQRLTATGSGYEPEQSFRPGGKTIPMADYKYTLTQSFKARQFHTEWSVDTHYPLIAKRNFTEIINGDYAAVVGVDSILNIPQTTMQATRMGARNKQYFATSPVAIIRYVMAHPKELTYLGVQNRNEHPQHRFAITGEAMGWEQAATLFVDATTKLPTQLETLEDDTIYGDMIWRVNYKNWQQIEGISLPTVIVHTLNDRLIHHVSYSDIDLLNTLDVNMFAVPDELKAPLETKLYAWGSRSSQWFGRFLLTGIPFDLDQSSEASVTLVDIAPGIVHIQGFTHNTLLVEMKDFLVVLDPPLYEQRTRTVLKAIKQRWENKPIKYIVPSHFHNDHIGGIRGYAADGASLIVGAETKNHYETLLKAPHSVYPDALALNPVETHVIEVPDDETFLITDGERKIRLFNLSNRHSIGMLIPYIEDEKLVFVSDLYNPDLFTTPLPPLFSFWSLDLLAGLKDSELEIEGLIGAHGGVVSYERFVSDVEASF